jgi:CO/xanthine dehydrogenase FAD-binding subunit
MPLYGISKDGGCRGRGIEEDKERKGIMSRVFLPRSLSSLWKVLEEEPGAIVYAGGTDLLVRIRQGVCPPCLLCLERIDELKEVRDLGNEVMIGACCSHSGLLENLTLRKNFPVLINALKVLGSPPVRNVGTIGGNICTASPAADTLPPLYVLGADLELRSKYGSRRVSLMDFILGPGKTALKSGEIVYGVWVKKAPEYNFHHFEKVGQRKALAIAIVSLAVVLRVSDSGVVQRARLAWGSVGPTTVTSAQVEEVLIGQPLSSEVLKKAVSLARKAVNPIDDVRASASYRRTVAGNLLWRLLGE